MPTTYNGYKPGERRAKRHKPLADDKGHGVVETATSLDRTGWRFTYEVKCECGKRYRGRTAMTPFDTWQRHQRREAANAD